MIRSGRPVDTILAMPPASRPPDRSLITALAASAVALGAVVAALAWLAVDRTPDGGAANLRALAPWWVASAAAWIALTVVILRLHRTKRPWRRGDGRSAALVIGLAVVARVVVILTHPPALSDDIFRYIFDGRTLASGANPYLVAPAERRPPDPPTPAQSIPVEPSVLGDAERWAGESAVVRLVNNAELHTIYLPTSQLLFAVAGALIPEEHRDPHFATQVFRALFVALEVVMMIALVLALRGSRRSAWWLAAYAWHPLALTEIAGEGHQDIAGVLLLVTALALYTASPKRIVGPIISLALAVLVKPVALPIAALLLKGRAWRTWLVAAAVGAVLCTALLAPFLLTTTRNRSRICARRRRASPRSGRTSAVSTNRCWQRSNAPRRTGPTIRRSSSRARSARACSRS